MTHNNPIREALRTAALTGEPPAGQVTQAVLREAGRLRFRQRVLAAAAGVATVGVLSAGALAMAGGGQGTPLPPAAQPPATSAAVTSSAQGFVDGMKILQALSGLLPQGVQTGDAQTETGYARVVLIDEVGQSLLEINVQPNFAADAKGGKPDLYRCPEINRPAYVCEQGELSEGVPFAVVQGPTGDQPPTSGVVRRTVAVLQPGRLRVVVSVYNAVDVKHGQPTRAEPALTVAQLKQIAAHPVWRG